MTALLGPADVRRLAAELDLHPRKSLGQNFVVDPNTIRRIVRLAQLEPGVAVLEVGPGLGSLTLGLLAEGHPVIAVELDARLAARLPGTVAERLPAAADGLTVVSADGMAVTGALGQPAGLVANLPYNVAVPVLLHVLATFPTLHTSLVMVQREVADRLAAPPGSRVYGVPSVKTAWYGHVERVGTVPPSVFWPVPRVDSGLVRISTDADPHHDPADVLLRSRVFAVVDRTFATRRKTLRTSLGAWLGPEQAAAALADAGVAGSLRPEQLGLAEFIALGRVIEGAPAR